MAKFTLQYTGEQIDEAVGLALDNINGNMAYVSEEEQENATVPLNADTLEGHNVNSLLNRIYPVGSIYMSISSTNPITLFGGTWEQIKDTFLLSAGDTYTAGAIGGEATHKLTIEEIPGHTHEMSNSFIVYDTSSTKKLDTTGNSTKVDTNNNVGATTKSTGGGQAHNNMPPYLAVYMWQRTA